MGLPMSLAKSLYELHQVDLEIQKKREILDEVSRQLGEKEALVKTRASLLDDEKHLAEIEKQQRDVEWEIDDLRSAIAKVNEKLYGGKVKNPKELLSFDQEVGIFKMNLGRKEDDLLEVMTEVEATQDTVKLAAERLKKLEADWRREQKILAQNQAEVEGQLVELAEKRQAATAGISAEALEVYEGMRSKKGQAVVKVEQGRCQGCRLTLPVSELQRARAGSLVRCSSCGRILYLG